MKEPNFIGSVPGGLSVASIGAMLLLAVMWGLSIPITKLGLVTMPPLMLTALRFAIAVPLMLLLSLGRGGIPSAALPKIAALGVLGIGIGQVSQTFGVQGTTASVGTILSATIPVFIVMFAALRLKQGVSPRQQLGLVAAFVGMALVASGQGSGGAVLDRGSLIGAAWMIISSLAIAFYYVWSVELTVAHGVAPVAAWSTLFGFISLLPWAAWEWSHTPATFTLQAVGSAAYLGVVVTAAGLYLWLYILRIVPARIAAAVQYLQPVVGIVASALIFGDVLSPLFAVGVALILFGLALAVAQSKPTATR